VIQVAIGSGPTSLDWPAVLRPETLQAALSIFEPLYAVDRDYLASPMLAADMPQVSADGLTYTIPLRTGVKFHNGQVMTADDVVASLQRWGKVANSGKLMFASVDSLEKTSDSQIQIRLKRRFGQLVTTLAVPVQGAAIMPKGVIDAAGANEIKQDDQIVGTGPFRLAEWRRGESYTLARFDGYTGLDRDSGGLGGQKRVSTKLVKVSFVTDPNTRLNGLLTGQFQYVHGLAGDQLARLTSEGQGVRIIRPGTGYLVWLNIHNPPFDDVRVRKAAAYSIDAQQVMSNTFGDASLYELDGALFLPEQKLLYSTAAMDTYGHFELNRARQLLVEAGSPTQEIVLIFTAADTAAHSIAVTMAQQLAAAGFNTRVEGLDVASHLQRQAQPRGWHTYLGTLSPGFLLPSGIAQLTGESPYSGFYAKGDAMAALVAQWASTSTDAERKALMDQIQTQLYVDQPLIKFGNSFGLAGVSPKLHINMSFFQPTYWDMWLTD
jgi:peptide/nickel transport system substrate-binding protein